MEVCFEVGIELTVNRISALTVGSISFVRYLSLVENYIFDSVVCIVEPFQAVPFVSLLAIENPFTLKLPNLLDDQPLEDVIQLVGNFHLYNFWAFSLIKMCSYSLATWLAASR